MENKQPMDLREIDVIMESKIIPFIRDAIFSFLRSNNWMREADLRIIAPTYFEHIYIKYLMTIGNYSGPLGISNQYYRGVKLEFTAIDHYITVYHINNPPGVAYYRDIHNNTKTSFSLYKQTA